MKKLAIIALAVAASSAFATGPGPKPGDKCTECPQIDINGVSVQAVSASFSVFSNEAKGDEAYAQQNVSSNSGNVTVDGVSVQLTSAKGAFVANLADGEDAYASQNISSNIGQVNITGGSLQATALYGTAVLNKAVPTPRPCRTSPATTAAWPASDITDCP